MTTDTVYVQDTEGTMMYLAQLRRRTYPRRPSLSEEVAYLQHFGASVKVEGTSLLVTWPVGGRFYD